MALARLLYISMLGEPGHYDPEDYRDLCPSGLEKHWTRNWHGPAAQDRGFAFAAVDVCRGEALPPGAEVDAVILGGTVHAVNEKRPWIGRLASWLESYRRLERPLLGICGGHQLVSILLSGADFGTRPSGTLAGTLAITLHETGRGHPLFAGLSSAPRFHFGNTMHIRPRPGFAGQILASLGESPAVAIDHGGGWYSCQFHPESRKAMWACYFGRKEPEWIAAFSENHDGERFLSNFLDIAGRHCGAAAPALARAGTRP